MATVDIQNNPVVPIVGAKDADAVIINSQLGSSNELVSYQIENIVTAAVINIDNAMSGQEGGNIIDVTKATLKIILESRTKYRVRAKTQFGDWSAWVNFKTRDKRYQSPEAVTQLTDDTDATAQTQGSKIKNGVYVAQGGSRTIVVTNNAKATEVDDSAVTYNQPRNWGAATVTNTDTIFNDGQLQRVDGAAISQMPVFVHTTLTSTNKGATVVNVPSGKNSRIRYTNRGATIDTRG